MSDNIDWGNPRIFVGDDGSALIPLKPEIARARLAVLQGNDGVVNALLDRSHPEHSARVLEQSMLHKVIVGEGAPRSPIEQVNDARAAKFGTNIQGAIDGHVAAVAAAGRAERDAS